MEVCEYPETYEQNFNEETNETVTSNAEENISEESDDYVDDIDDDESFLTYNQDLRDRIIQLRTTLYDLKKQLREEKESWTRELERLNAENNCRYSHVGMTCDISQLHQETKAQLQRQLAITNYKRRLLEVESMCNMELMRVKQNVKFLEPLQMMISEWHMDNSVNSFIDQSGDHLSCKSSKDDLNSSTESDLKLKESSSIQLEMISTKLYNDMNDMFNVLSTHCQETIPNWNQENSLQSQSSAIFSDCGQHDVI